MASAMLEISARMEDCLDEVVVTAADISPARLTLAKPLRTARGAMTVRDIRRIRFDAVVGGLEVTGWGEVAPLPGWSQETLKHADYELGRISERVAARGEVQGTELLEILRTPSVRFGVSSALLDACARARNVPMRRLFSREAPNSIAVNGTIGGVSPDEAFAEAERLVRDGFETLKVKIGVDDLDLDRVAAVRRAAPAVALRVDANGAWDLGTARKRLEVLAEFEVEYCEQPVPADRMEDLGMLRAESGIPIAADESCFPQERALDIVRQRLADILVLKPSLYGSWGELSELAFAAGDAGIEVVFTSAIDGAISRAAVAQMASVFVDDRACGLATGAWISEDVDGWEEVVRGGRLYLGSGSGIGFAPRN